MPNDLLLSIATQQEDTGVYILYRDLTHYKEKRAPVAMWYRMKMHAKTRQTT